MATTPNPRKPPPRPMGPVRPVTCYHCGHAFDIAARALSGSCPKCSKPLSLHDVVVKTAHFVRKLQTCGRVVVEAKGQLNASVIHAQSGVEVLGTIEGNVTSGGPVTIGSKARWKGDCRAPALSVADGARITRGYFEVPFHALASDNVAQDGHADDEQLLAPEPAEPQIRAISTRRPRPAPDSGRRAPPPPAQTEAKPRKAKAPAKEPKAEPKTEPKPEAKPAKKVTTRKSTPKAAPKVTIRKPPSDKPPSLGKPPKGAKKKKKR